MPRSRSTVIARARLVVAQAASHFVVADLFDGLRLDLPDTLAGHPELLAHLLERVVDAVLEAVPEEEDLALFRGEVVEDLVELLGEDLARGLLVGRVDGLVFDEVAQDRAVVVVGADWVLKRDGVLIDLLDQVDLVHLDAHFDGDLFGGRVAAEVLGEPAEHLLVLRDGLHHVHGDADRA